MFNSPGVLSDRMSHILNLSYYFIFVRIGMGDDTYNYVGEWDELMEEAKPEIAQMVEELKGRLYD